MPCITLIIFLHFLTGFLNHSLLMLSIGNVMAAGFFAALFLIYNGRWTLVWLNLSRQSVFSRKLQYVVLLVFMWFFACGSFYEYHLQVLPIAGLIM